MYDDYKSLCPVVTVCNTVVYTQTDRQNVGNPYMSTVVRCINCCTMCNELASDHVLAIETGDMQACVAVAAHCIHLNAIVEQQAHDVDLTAS